jgi:hypothetical protein
VSSEFAAKLSPADHAALARALSALK